jgi:Holliday junction resolvasome RuvABC endonuclease subunit
MNKFNILTNDPSMTAWGWAVVNSYGVVLKTGCIKTEPSPKKLHIRKGDDRTRRVSEINNKLSQIIEEYDIKYLLSELPHGSQNAMAAVMIGIVIGVLQTIADFEEIGIEWFSEGDSKDFLLGKRSATKEETII